MSRYSEEEMKVHTLVYQSWGAFVEASENGKTDMPESQRASRDRQKSFNGVETYTDAYKLAKDGWKEGTVSINEMATPLFDHVSKMIERVEVNHDVEGHSIDVARFIDGEPEAWMKFENVLKEADNGHRLIRVVFNICASAMVDAEVMTRKGAAVAALVELLEYAGHRVELILTIGVEGYGADALEVYTRLKEFDQNLDTSVLAFALAHPASFRILFFAIMEQCPAALRHSLGVPGGYGRPRDIKKENRGDVYIGRSWGPDLQWESADGAEKWVIDQLKAQGITLNIGAKTV